MQINSKGIALIKEAEGFRSKPYLCPAGVPTIGYGTTYYPDGRKVSLKDRAITEEEASRLLNTTLLSYEKTVDSYTTDNVNSNQFSALVCFAYNLGTQALKTSTLLKKVNQNPKDVSIRTEFLKWIYSDGEALDGLKTRRQKEADLYVS